MPASFREEWPSPATQAGPPIDRIVTQALAARQTRYARLQITGRCGGVVSFFSSWPWPRARCRRP